MCSKKTTLETVTTSIQEAPPLYFENKQGEGVYFFGKRYTEMTPGERAAYRKSLIDDYAYQVLVEVDD